MIGNSYVEGNFPDKVLLTNRQVANLCKAYQLKSSYQKLNYLKWCNQVDFVVHWSNRLTINLQ